MPLAAAPETLDLSETKPQFRGAELLGLLAYPEPDRLDDRAQAAFRFAYLADPTSYSTWVQTGGGVIPVDRRQAEGGRKRLEARLQRRLLAGKVAAQGLHVFETGEPMNYQQGRKWTLDAALRQQAGEDPWRATTNMHRRIWVSSTPVIHIATAWARTLMAEAKRRGASPSLHALILDPSFRDAVVAESVRLEGAIPACEALRVGAEDLIKLR